MRNVSEAVSELSVEIQSQNVSQVRNASTNHRDLVELAGYHAYLDYSKERIFKVNGKDYEVLDTVATDSGLNAMTVMNLETGEITIVYQGSTDKTDWVDTNLWLITDRVPEQLEDARRYYEEMKEKYGEIHSVTGNSLGGALADYVGIDNPDVEVVALNPALLPEGTVDTKANYDNITNYYTKYDGLTIALETLGYGDHIPGKKAVIRQGVPSFDNFSANHTGFIRDPITGETKGYVVGKPGEPGYGVIYVDADDHVMTSIWRGYSLHTGHREIIQINGPELEVLARSMQTEVLGRLERVYEYFTNSYAIVQHEHDMFYQRLTKLQDSFKDLFQQYIGQTVFGDILSTMKLISELLDKIINVLNKLEQNCRKLNVILNSPPMELIEFITRTDISVESIFGSLRNAVAQLDRELDFIHDYLRSIVIELIPELFKGTTNHFADAVVGEMKAHYEIVLQNMEKITKQIALFKMLVQRVGKTFQQKDAEIATAIASKRGVVDSDVIIKPFMGYTMIPSPYMRLGLRIKEQHLETVYNRLTGHIQILLNTAENLLTGVLRLIRDLIESLLAILKGVINISLKLSAPTRLVFSIFTDWKAQLDDVLDRVFAQIDELKSFVFGLIDGLQRLVLSLPDVLYNFRHYLDDALFNISRYNNVNLYNTASVHLLEDLQLLFDDIVFQLSHQKADAIDVLAEQSKIVKRNLRFIEDQIRHVTFNVG